jgi:hypothetical protein
MTDSGVVFAQSQGRSVGIRITSRSQTEASGLKIFCFGFERGVNFARAGLRVENNLPGPYLQPSICGL